MELLNEWKSAQPHQFKTRKMANQKSLRQFLSSQVASRYSKRPSFHSLERSDCEITALRCWRRNGPSTHQRWIESVNPQSKHSCLKQSRLGSDSISNDKQLRLQGCCESRNAQHQSCSHRYEVLFHSCFTQFLNFRNFVDQWVQVPNPQSIDCAVIDDFTFAPISICYFSGSDC